MDDTELSKKEKDKERSRIYREKNKDVILERSRIWRESHREEIRIKAIQIRVDKHEDIKAQSKKYRDANAAIILDKQRKNREENKDEINKWFREYRHKNSETTAANHSEYFKRNRLKINDRQKRYCSNKRKTDPLFRLSCSVKNLIRYAVSHNGFKKIAKTEQILGCTYSEFKDYLESKFEPWMNWDNRGNWNGVSTELGVSWDIDHIVPMKTAITEDDVIRLNHYTNLQPLCTVVNRRDKRAKINYTNND